MHIAGLDVGFAPLKRTNALAVLQNGHLTVEKLSVKERNERLAELTGLDAIAIDAPLVPPDCEPHTPRFVERLFSLGLFQKRCKPGMSHIPGTGRLLREHGAMSAQLVSNSSAKIVEAFPNAFLGVLLDDDVYLDPPKLRRGKKFDWLYDECAKRELFAELIRSAGLPEEVAIRMMNETDHDRRSALVCLVTAAFAHLREAEMVGDVAGGYFALPPRRHWAEWAESAIFDSPNEFHTKPGN